MSMRKSLRTLALCVVVTFAFVLTVSTAGTVRAGDKGEPRRMVNALPPVSLASGQTLLVNFFNVGSNPLEIVPCILDADGAHIKTGPHVRLAPGQTISFDMSRAETPTHGGKVAGDETTAARLVVRGAAHVRQAAAKNLLITGAVIEETTGRSSLYLAPGTIRGFNPQPDPPREGEIR